MDRHVTEFFPQIFGGENAYFGLTLGVDAFPFEAVVELGDRIHAEVEQHALSPNPLPGDYFESIVGEHEQVVDIIESIRKDRGYVFSANLPNQGQVPNLPPEVIVESPAMANGAGVRPVALPPLEPGLVASLATRYHWGETLVDAAIDGDRRKFVQAMSLDGAVKSLDVAERLADDLLNVQIDYLPQFQHAN